MSLQEAISKIEKTYGKGNIMNLDEARPPQQDALDTGIFGLNWALGIGGLPIGRIIEVYGQEGVGKSTIALSTIAEAQKKDLNCAYIDAEHALNIDFAKMLGVDPKKLIISQIDYGEQGLDIAEMLIQSGDVRLIVIDSVAALVPKAELEAEMVDQQMGLQARMMSKALRKLTAIMNKSKCSVMFINQLREKIGIMFGNPTTTTGGKALKFYSSVRLEASRGEQFKDGDKITGHEVKIKVVKNKVAPPYKTCTFDLSYTEGISSEGFILNISIEKGLIKRSGSWYSYEDQKIGQGADSVKQYIKTNEDFRNILIGKVFDK
ncbi:MAG: recombinase RecA [Methanogenium sp.]|jgi:recombination protein RecA